MSNIAIVNKVNTPTSVECRKKGFFIDGNGNLYMRADAHDMVLYDFNEMGWIEEEEVESLIEVDVELSVVNYTAH